MSALPMVRIKYAWLFKEGVSEHLNKLWGDGKPLREDDEYSEIAEKYRKAWQPLESKILTAMTDTLGLSFRQNVVDVYIAPWMHAFSDPLVIGVIFSPDVFVDMLTHELLHRLLTDNTDVPADTDLRTEWKKLFGADHSFRTLVHIPVHAVHKAIYLDVLKAPERLERDIAGNKEHGATDYVKAWDYVEEHGYQNIIDQLKNSYQDMRGLA